MPSPFTYSVEPSEYDDKLTIQFDYDEDLVDKLRTLKKRYWQETHAGYHDPDNDEYDSALDGYVDYRCWHIDHDEQAISLFEKVADTVVPAEYWPGDAACSGDVTLRVTDDECYFVVEDAPERAHDLLEEKLSYEVPDAEFTNAYENGHWDGTEKLYNRARSKAAIGLLPKARRALDNEGFDVTVDTPEPNRGASIATSWGFEHPLRDYQRDAVNNTIDNSGGIISLPTGTGKTVTALRILYELNRRSVILVHTKELLYQWTDEVRDVLGVEPGVIGDGNWSEGPVTVAIMQTLMSRGLNKLDDDYGVVVFDEAHRTSAADTMHELGTSINAHYRVGLSATPWRRVDGEELKIEGAIGEVAHEVYADDMIEAGHLANPVFEAVDPRDYGQPRTPDRDEQYQDAYKRCIELDPVRIEAVATSARDLARQGHQVLVNVNRKVQGELIAAALNTDIDEEDVFTHIDDDDESRQLMTEGTLRNLDVVADTNAAMLSSEAADSEREAILDEFANGDRSILVSTLLKEGVNIPSISAIVLAQGEKSDIETIQTIGRALRPSDNTRARIVDVADSGRYFSDAFEARQDAIMDYYDLSERPAPDTAVPAVGDTDVEPAVTTTTNATISATNSNATFEDFL